MRDRRLVDLRNGRTSDELVEWLAGGDPRTVVGLDFAFSFPRCCPGVRRELPAERTLRRTDRDAGTAKSVFQVGGAGAVGTGSIRGMPSLLALARHGFSVWPFQEPAWPRVVEIYPRALVRGRVQQLAGAERHAYLFAQIRRPAGRACSSARPARRTRSTPPCRRWSWPSTSASWRRCSAWATTPMAAIEGTIWRP